jgi:hypothetical protein
MAGLWIFCIRRACSSGNALITQESVRKSLHPLQFSHSFRISTYSRFPSQVKCSDPCIVLKMHNAHGSPLPTICRKRSATRTGL